MNKRILYLVLSVLPLTACGGDGDNKNEPKDIAHFFDKPYQCKYESSYVSKSTGKIRTIKKTLFYHPQKHWHISANFVANLYTPTHRYDGTGNLKDGEIQSVKFVTAWLSHKPENKERAKRKLSKVDKKDCFIMKDASIFDIDYLDNLEVMNGDKKPNLDKAMKSIATDTFKDAKIPQRYKDAIDGKQSSTTNKVNAD